MIALVEIPHQRPCRLNWYASESELIQAADAKATQEGRPIDAHGFTEAASNAAHELASDWNGYWLIRTIADLDELQTYQGHKAHELAALLPGLQDQFSPATTNQKG